MAMQARQQQQEVEVEDETFGPMPLNRLEVFIAVEFPIFTFELLRSSVSTEDLIVILRFLFLNYYYYFSFSYSISQTRLDGFS